MVSEQKDMLDRVDARPTGVTNRIELAKEITESGEASLLLTDGSVVEVHNYDTHFYVDSGVVFTETDDLSDDNEDVEAWLFADEIVAVYRH